MRWGSTKLETSFLSVSYLARKLGVILLLHMEQLGIGYVDSHSETSFELKINFTDLVWISLVEYVFIQHSKKYKPVVILLQKSKIYCHEIDLAFR